MGILRKYLWLVLPIVFFANYASADTCENDPYACTPAKLCSKTTEKINNVLYWISSEEDKHLKIARKIKLNCGAKDAMSSCQKDASECSILELCEMSVTKEVSATNWNEINPRHVKLAKSFSLDCGVSPSANSNTLTSPCDENPSACISEELCEKATYGVVGNKNWTTPQVFAEFVKEAKQRGLTCGVISISNDKTCSQDVLNCTPAELCKLATKKNANGKSIWSMAEYRKKYIEEAQRRNISCGVKVDIEDVKIAKLIKIFSDANNSCRGASADKISTWEKCVERTKTSQALQKYGFCYGKASDDGAYKYRWHECEEASYRIDKKQHEKSLIKYQNKIEGITRERKSALETQKKGKADEKARLATSSCNENPAACTSKELCQKATFTVNKITDWKVGGYKEYVDEAKRQGYNCKAIVALEAEKKRKADEKKRLALEAEKKKKSSSLGSCKKLHKTLAKYAKTIFGKQDNSKDNWFQCINSTLFFKPAYGGSVITYTQNKNFRGIVYQKNNYGFQFDGPVVCYDLDLNIKKRGYGRTCK